VIGLCTALEQARWGPWDVPAAVLAYNYVESVHRAGGLAVLLPPDPRAVEDPDGTLDLLDALILAGGSDVDPASFGAERHPAVVHTTPERDAFELALAERAIERDIPFLGICRGMQILNVARGGTLLQHLPDDLGTHDHLRNHGTFEGSAHEVRLDEGSLAARAAGEETHRVLSHHHQAIDRLGTGLTVTGRAVGDALPEAIEDRSAGFALAVQWHPEADETSRLIGALVREAAGRLAAAG
jgi:putative glutamine amidotransferase